MKLSENQRNTLLEGFKETIKGYSKSQLLMVFAVIGISEGAAKYNEIAEKSLSCIEESYTKGEIKQVIKRLRCAAATNPDTEWYGRAADFLRAAIIGKRYRVSPAM